MTKNILIFRCDRIGDLLLSCPSIKSIKESSPDTELTVVTSEKNFSYAKTLKFFDKVYLFPKKNILKKIIFIKELRKIKYDKIFIYDGKERSIISTFFLNANIKVGLITKHKLYYNLSKIKFFLDNDENDIHKIFHEFLKFTKNNNNITNFNFLTLKPDNKFASNLNIKNYLHIHLDEKWFSQKYISHYTDINPSFNQFTSFLDRVSSMYNVLITTGLTDLDLIERLKNEYFNKRKKNIFYKKLNNLIYLVDKPTFEDLESMLRNTEILIACHGAITHASNSFNIKKIDIIEEKKEKHYNRLTSYLRNYCVVYRSEFIKIERNLSKIIFS